MLFKVSLATARGFAPGITCDCDPTTSNALLMAMLRSLSADRTGVPKKCIHPIECLRPDGSSVCLRCGEATGIDAEFEEDTGPPRCGDCSDVQECEERFARGEKQFDRSWVAPEVCFSELQSDEESAPVLATGKPGRFHVWGPDGSKRVITLKDWTAGDRYLPEMTVDATIPLEDEAGGAQESQSPSGGEL